MSRAVAAKSIQLGIGESTAILRARIHAKIVGAHRLLLANASHELRTPLSRIRLGIELLDGRPDARVKAELAQDIAELDDLIEEILLTSRLDVAAMPLIAEEVDLLALMAEECARYDGCSLDGERMTVAGDPRLLRRPILRVEAQSTSALEGSVVRWTPFTKP